MTKEEIIRVRLTCLQLAFELGAHTTKDVLETAKQYLAFVFCGEE